MSGWTVYHNPDCGTSRKVLAALRQAGREPEVVEYKKAGWTRPQLESLFAQMGVTPRDVLRVQGTPAGELGLLNADVSDDAIIEAMVAHPILVNRPIVASPESVKLCRPAEKVHQLL